RGRPGQNQDAQDLLGRVGRGGEGIGGKDGERFQLTEALVGKLRARKWLTDERLFDRFEGTPKSAAGPQRLPGRFEMAHAEAPDAPGSARDAHVVISARAGDDLLALQVRLGPSRQVTMVRHGMRYVAIRRAPTRPDLSFVFHSLVSLHARSVAPGGGRSS